MALSHVVIRLDEFGKGVVIVDGVPLKSTKSVKLDAKVRQATIVTVEFFATVEFEGPATVIEGGVDNSQTEGGTA